MAISLAIPSEQHEAAPLLGDPLESLHRVANLLLTTLESRASDEDRWACIDLATEILFGAVAKLENTRIGREA
ncbi:hypothetical protein Rvan_1494 [Rhodomicrobium vannielii ATCC 17100]|uniref:Uncharacterized protein n=1 Tax=Rhodomicrobium vannielii (strain ATCC 17100 / DSM 162 / LMG 4299 / NCIMB 10020 / ATH 3.1.1) TaxID=648757 RepID=E3I798_RHOVT|nr:hypothetical protein [Rhodomicrobium vannielii]ADP70749.1 hypothetical protein Rvan_1494 [Rhodomicrobium vannielii ATCC 17100]